MNKGEKSKKSEKVKKMKKGEKVKKGKSKCDNVKPILESKESDNNCDSESKDNINEQYDKCKFEIMITPGIINTHHKSRPYETKHIIHTRLALITQTRNRGTERVHVTKRLPTF